MSYRFSHTDPQKGKRYHSCFIRSPYRKMVWKFEQQLLDQILSSFFNGRNIHHLDFACGTGRIISYLENKTCTSIGVDVSSSMLEVAKKNVTSSQLIQADITQHDIFKNKKFNLITAFRFFPNAEDELRKDAMKALSNLLDYNGYLIFNNHKHTGSTRNRLARLVGRRNFKGMSIDEARYLTELFDLEIVKIYGLCIFPASEKHQLLPITILSLLESCLQKFSLLHQFGENLIFVCQPQKTKN